VEEVVAGGVVVVAAVVVGEVVAEGRSREFFGEEVDFVQEKDLRGKKRFMDENCVRESGAYDGGLDEPS
jgi:hypothetical protein